MNTNRKTIPSNINIERGETQINVNKTVLEELINRYNTSDSFELLDLPCGKLTFLKYVRTLFPSAELSGADIMPASNTEDINFIQMDLSIDFHLPQNKQYDVITSISGVMMFGNTKNFIDNCIKHLKPGGTFIITNDNSATIKDRISYLALGRFRIFGQVFEDNETLTQLVLIQELTRLLRINNISIERIEYTSLYPKDLIFLPFAMLVYPIQLLYLFMKKTSLPKKLIFVKYSFKQMFYRHYVIVGKKM